MRALAAPRGSSARRRRRGSIAAAALASVAATLAPAAVTAAAPAPGDDEGEPRLSLPTEPDREAWQRAGLRLGLGLSFGALVGLEGAPSGQVRGASLRLGLRLDADWSVLASFEYTVASSSSGGLSGLRYSGTIDPTWHLGRHLALAVGIGFGGFVEAGSGRPDVAPLPGTLDGSYTLPSPRPPLPSCDGVGAAALARAEWSIVLGPRSAASFTVEAIGQWTGCVANTGRVDPDTGQAIVRRQWWPHAGAIAGGGITWR